MRIVIVEMPFPAPGHYSVTEEEMQHAVTQTARVKTNYAKVDLIVGVWPDNTSRVVYGGEDTEITVVRRVG